MKIVASVTSADSVPAAIRQGAGLIEIRLDLAGGDPVQEAGLCRQAATVPVIVTLRSADEGGKFTGTAEEWSGIIGRVLPSADYVDVERKFAAHAHLIRSREKPVIASFHTTEMPVLFNLFALERELREYGDIVKIVVAPKSEEDVISLISFTHAALKPVCTGIMGARFRYARAILPLFGSEFAYCHAGVPTAEGQYSVGEFVRLMDILYNRQAEQ